MSDRSCLHQVVRPTRATPEVPDHHHQSQKASLASILPLLTVGTTLTRNLQVAVLERSHSRALRKSYRRHPPSQRNQTSADPLS